MTESLSSPAPNDPLTELRTHMDTLSVALQLWAVGDRTTLDVEQAGTTAIETAMLMIAQLDDIQTVVDREIRARRDAAYRADVSSRHEALMASLKNAQSPYTSVAADALLGAYDDGDGTGLNDCATGEQSS